ncbi:MAG: cytidylate kinase family protein [Candidatus Aenigmarchaeota archaeon]|nr:cytidylate kinase family protein [Candidatus Aenigmarchaeota archaeon]
MSKTFVKFFEEYEKEYSKDHPHTGLTITISGRASSGKTTGAKAIVEYLNNKYGLGLRYYSTGAIFRELAAKEGIPIEEFAEKRDDRIDIMADQRTLELAIVGGVVLDGRLTGYIAGNWAELRIFYNPPPEVRARRYAEREGVDYKTALENVRRRDEADERRYKSLYRIDLNDLSIYHIIIDNSNWSAEDAKIKIVEIVEEFLRKNNLLK